jgi:hypothetical protein
LATASCLAFDSSNDAIDLKTPAKPTANQMIVDTTISSGKPAVLAAAWARAMCLQTAFLNEALLDRRDVRLGIAKRVRRRVDRVVPQDEIVLVRSGRAENELGIGQRSLRSTPRKPRGPPAAVRQAPTRSSRQRAKALWAPTLAKR